MIEDNPDALWSRAQLDEMRVRRAPELTRIVVAVDPPATSGANADECGIVVAGVDAEGRGFVLDDRSMGGLTPLTWASRAAKAYRDFEADRIVAESNQGGDQGGRKSAQTEPLTFLPREMEDIACLALSICRVLEVEDDEEGQVAMACAILNHMRRFGREGGGQGGAAARVLKPLSIERLPWRAFAIACLVVSGDMEDPTGGATHFHRHTENPEWAQAATPKALIGNYVYYVMPLC